MDKNNLIEKSYKVLALDLDGTVLNSDHCISSALRKKIHQLKEKVHVVLVTGRHHTAAKPYYRELGLNTPIICCNGTYVFDYENDRVIEHNAISKYNAQKFIKIAEENSFKLIMYIKDAMLYSRAMPIAYMERLSEWAKEYDNDIRPNIRCVDSFLDELDKTEYIWKFVIEGDDSKGFDELDFVRKHFSGERSWIDRIDYANNGNSKGNALARYVSKLGYRSDQVVAVGDNFNDISMLEYAGCGVAMLNADNTVKQSAQLTTLADNDDEHCLANLFDDLFSNKHE